MAAAGRSYFQSHVWSNVQSGAACVPGWAGVCGFAGHAVNPSLEARERHPWRPTVPRTHTPPPQTVSRWPGQGQSGTEQSNTSALKDAASSLRTSTLSKAGYGWVGGTVGRHGWRSRAYTDVLAACPANPPVPGQASAGTNARPLILLRLKLWLPLRLWLRLSASKKKYPPKKNAPTEAGACPLERDLGSVLRGQGDPGEGRIALHPHVPGTGRR